MPMRLAPSETRIVTFFVVQPLISVGVTSGAPAWPRRPPIILDVASFTVTVTSLTEQFFT